MYNPSSCRLLSQETDFQHVFKGMWGETIEAQSFHRFKGSFFPLEVDWTDKQTMLVLVKCGTTLLRGGSHGNSYSGAFGSRESDVTSFSSWTSWANWTRSAIDARETLKSEYIKIFSALTWSPNLKLKMLPWDETIIFCIPRVSCIRCQ